MPKIPSIDKLKALRPKAPPFIAEFTRRHLARFQPSFWIYSSTAVLLVLILFIFLTDIFLIGSSLSRKAIETGQRVFVTIDNGKVEGNARHTQVVETAATETSATIGSKEGLAPAPLASISARSEQGVVPTTSKNGIVPWKYYARPYKFTDKRPIVAIVITHLGLNKSLTEEALKLPHAFTLSFSPYASDARKWASMARDTGFETLVDLPMQSTDYIRTGADPGPHGLFEDMSIDEANKRLLWILSRFAGFVGVLAPEDESVTTNLTSIRPTMIELTGHGVLFLYVKTPKNVSLMDVIKARQLYALGIDKVIDTDIAPQPIDTQLQDLTTLAKTQGYAIGFAHSYPPTLDALNRWSSSLEGQGVDLVPVSAVGMRVFP